MLVENGLDQAHYFNGGVWTSNVTQENEVDPKDLYEGNTTIMFRLILFYHRAVIRVY